MLQRKVLEFLMFIPFSIEHLVVALFLALLCVAAIHDATTYRIPNRVSLAIAALYPTHVLASGGDVAWMGALLVAAAVFAAGMALFAFGVLGGGDVKLLAATALWAGPAGLAGLLVITAIGGGLMALFMTSSLRFGLALALEAAGRPGVRQMVLGITLPYGVAIAAGGWFTTASLVGG